MGRGRVEKGPQENSPTYLLFLGGARWSQLHQK